MLSVRNQKFIPILLLILALAVRLIHNGYFVDSPLYHYPFGGHQPYFDFALQIYQGNFNPWQGAITLNSPGYSYLVGLIYKLIGPEDFHGLRLISIFVDSCSVVLIYLISLRFFTPAAALTSGLLAIFCGPLIFYSAELTEIPFSTFLLLLGVYRLNCGSLIRITETAICYGLAILIRPDLIICLPFLALYILVQKVDWRILKSLLFCCLTICCISPLALINYSNTKEFIPLTASSGHNFYIGHNPDAQPGYQIPRSLDGDIFVSMKNLAENTTGQVMSPKEISSFYYQKSWEYMLSNPIAELSMIGRRLKAFISDYEATTYTSYYYQKEISPLLQFAIPIGLLFGLALLVITKINRENLILLIPIFGSLLNILLFFFLSRLRAPALPFVIILAGVGATLLIQMLREQKFRNLALSTTTVITLVIVSYLNLPQQDVSNEYNKLGIAYSALKDFSKAEESFQEAIRRNPANPDSYANLQRLQERKYHNN